MGKGKPSEAPAAPDQAVPPPAEAGVCVICSEVIDKGDEEFMEGKQAGFGPAERQNETLIAVCAAYCCRQVLCALKRCCSGLTGAPGALLVPSASPLRPAARRLRPPLSQSVCPFSRVDWSSLSLQLAAHAAAAGACTWTAELATWKSTSVSLFVLQAAGTGLRHCFPVLRGRCASQAVVTVAPEVPEKQLPGMCLVSGGLNGRGTHVPTPTPVAGMQMLSITCLPPAERDKTSSVCVQKYKASKLRGLFACCQDAGVAVRLLPSPFAGVLGSQLRGSRLGKFIATGHCTWRQSVPCRLPAWLQTLVSKRPKYFFSNEGVKCPRKAGSGVQTVPGSKKSKEKAKVVAGGCPGTCIGE